jgi:hypothetical protein
MHPDKEVEVVPHQTKSKNFSKIDPAQSPDQVEQKVLLHIPENESGKGSPRNDMVNPGLSLQNHPRYPRHDPPLLSILNTSFSPFDSLPQEISVFKHYQPVPCPLRIPKPAANGSGTWSI